MKYWPYAAPRERTDYSLYIAMGLVGFMIGIAPAIMQPAVPQVFGDAENVVGGLQSRVAKLEHDQVLTPEHFGAVGDDNEPDTAALQELAESRSIVQIPPCGYLLDDTLVFRKRSGDAILGSGITEQMPPHQFAAGKLGGPASRLEWVGEPGGTMLEYSGTGLYLRGISLFGNRHRQEERAGIGLLVTHGPRRGLGTGKIHIPALAVGYCDTAVQFGKTQGEHNCDNVLFGLLQVRNCGVGVRAVNNQAMDHVYSLVTTGRVGTVFRYDEGGSIVCDYVLAAYSVDTILSLGNPGSNNGKYVVRYVKQDNQVADCYWLKMDRPAPARVEFLGGHISGSGMARFECKGETTLTIRDVSGGLREGSLQLRPRNHHRGTPNVLIERCHVTDPESLPDADSHGYHLRWRDCYDYWGNPIDDGEITAPTDHSLPLG